MRASLFALALLLIPSLAVADSADFLGPQRALFDEALAQAGLTAADVRIDPADRSFFGGDRYRLPFFDALNADPWKLSPYVRTITDMMLSKAHEPATVLISAQSRLNQGVRLGLTGDPLAPYLARIEELGDAALATSIRELGGEVEVTGGMDSIPIEVQRAAALILLVVPDALEYRERALTLPIKRLGYDPQEVYDRVLASTLADEQNDDIGGSLDNTLLIEQLLDNVDFQLLNTGATLLLLAVQKANGDLMAIDPATMNGIQLLVHTPLGYICIGDGFDSADGNSTVNEPEGPSLLGILTNNGMCGGPQGGNCSYANPISVCLDLHPGEFADGPWDSIVGTQRSFRDYRCYLGAGVFGYGIYADCFGNDAYMPGELCLGAGLFGCGIYLDYEGDDHYDTEQLSQGCGLYGTGLLIDLDGNDYYRAYQTSQGYGFTNGIGLLLDVSGDDDYWADDENIKYPSAQTAEHNTSMCQGVGNGRRGDYLDGHSWAGGVGMLIDGVGDDSYSAGLFAQACSYWYGTGILCDKGGNDKYNGVWYVQGSGAHFGLSCLQDDAGDDSYIASMNMAQGAGHDFSLSWLEDSAGNDSYSAPNLSLGGGNANGIGVFWDKAGDDRYLSKGVTLGAAGGIASPSIRSYMLNLGLFIDGGGTDTYLEDKGEGVTAPWDFAGDGKLWSRQPMSDPAGLREYGVGVDGAQ